MKVSWDFDNTLGHGHVQEFCKELMSKNVEVWITTSRLAHEDNSVVWDVCRNINFPVDNVVMTSHQPKWKFMTGFVWHLDDMQWEIDLINEKTSTVGINLWEQKDWKELCLKLLNL